MIGLVGLSACSTTSGSIPKAKLAEHPDGRGIPPIDEVIVSMKKEFIENCYTPVMRREVPETRCQTDLFQLLERRYRMNYRKEHVDMASDDIFFRDVDQRIRVLIRKDPEVRQMVKAQFSSQQELLRYYKELYGFHPVTSTN